MLFARPLALVALLALFLMAARVSSEEELDRPLGERHGKRRPPIHYDEYSPTSNATVRRHYAPFAHVSIGCRSMLMDCRNATNAWNCLGNAPIVDDNCSTFVKGLIACHEDAKSVAGCEKASNVFAIRRCLRKLRESGSRLSTACQVSPISRFSRHKRHNGLHSLHNGTKLALRDNRATEKRTQMP